MAIRPPLPSLRETLRSGNIFGGGTLDNLQAAQDSTYSNLRAPIAPYANSAAGLPPASMAAPGSQTAPGSALNMATGNIFGGTLPQQTRTDLQQLPVAAQTAGVLTGAVDQGKIADYNARLKYAGISLDPTGQFPDEFQNSLKAAAKIHDNVFSTPGTAPAAGGYQTYAPTDLRAQALANPGQPVTGYGGTVATGTPGTVGDTKNPLGGSGWIQPGGLPLYQQTGAKFTLTQNPNTVPGAPGYVPGPGASPAPAAGAAGGGFAKDAAAFQQAATGYPEAMKAAFAPGVTDHVGAFVQAGGHTTPQMLKALADIEAKRATTQAKIQNQAGIEAAYAPDLKPAGADASPTASGASDPVADAQAHLRNAVQAGLTDHSVIAKLSSNVELAKKQVAQDQAHQMILSQVNEQNKSLMDNISAATKLADSAGPIAKHFVGQPFGQNVSRLHALVNSIGSNEMMDYIQRLKAQTPTGTTGIGRILDREADAMTNIFASLKDPGLPAEAQDPEFLKKQLGDLAYHSARLNLVVNKIDPESRTFADEKAVQAAVKAGKIQPGDRVIVDRRPATWK